MIRLAQLGTLLVDDAARPAGWCGRPGVLRPVERLPVKGVTLPSSLQHTTGHQPRTTPHTSPLQSAVDRASAALYRRQADDGHWVGELQGDTILESEYILL